MDENERNVRGLEAGPRERHGRQIACRTGEGDLVVGVGVTTESTESVPAVVSVPLRAALCATNAALKVFGLEIVVE